MLFGSSWGLTVFLSGLWQGLGAELVFALFAYRRWGLVAAVLAGAGAGIATGINDVVVWYPEVSAGWKSVYAVSAVISGLVVAGALGWLLVRALARTGALTAFAAGRSQVEV
jgi:energy-coupling factor transport system permease protein